MDSPIAWFRVIIQLIESLHSIDEALRYAHGNEPPKPLSPDWDKLVEEARKLK